FLPREVGGKYDVLQWVAWQVANLGPVAGQLNHFTNYAAEKLPYAIDRFTNEMNRLLGVLERRLADRSYLAGEYSIADIATWPWVFPEYQGRQVLADFPHVRRWWDAVASRPAVRKGPAAAASGRATRSAGARHWRRASDATLARRAFAARRAVRRSRSHPSGPVAPSARITRTMIRWRGRSREQRGHPQSGAGSRSTRACGPRGGAR